MESLSRVECGLPPMVRGESDVTVRGFDFSVTWHHFQNPDGWVEEDVTINGELTLDGDRCQDLLSKELYREVMDAVDRDVKKSPAW